MPFQLFKGQAGDNQFGDYGTGLPGVVPQASNQGFPGQQGVGGGMSAVGGGTKAHGKDLLELMPMDPWLSSNFFNFLQSQIGQGATPFNLSTGLPSQNGAMTNPGQLSAPLTPILQQLNEFYQGKNVSMPGMNTLSEISKTGIPVDQLPAWQTMIEAQQRNIGQNEGNLREQFASLGNLKGSPFGTAMTDFRTQTSRDQNALLAAMTAQAGENAAGRRLQASGALAEGGFNIGQMLQGFDQQAIDRLVQEFIRTRPEYSPYLNMLYGAATTFPPYMQKQSGGGFLGGLAGAAGTAIGAGLGSLLGPIGTAIGSKVGGAIGGKAAGG